MPRANDAQEARFQTINDSYGVAEFLLVGGVLHVTTDEGHRGEIHRDGTVTWEPVATDPHFDNEGHEIHG